MSFEIMPSEYFDVLFLPYSRAKPKKHDILIFLEKEIPWYNNKCIVDIRTYKYQCSLFLIISVTKNIEYIKEQKTKRNKFYTFIGILLQLKNIDQNSTYNFGNEYIKLGHNPSRVFNDQSHTNKSDYFETFTNNDLHKMVKKNRIHANFFPLPNIKLKILMYSLCLVLILLLIFHTYEQSKHNSDKELVTLEECSKDTSSNNKLKSIIETQSFHDILFEIVLKVSTTKSKILSLSWKKDGLKQETHYLELILHNGDPSFFNEHENRLIKYENTIPIFCIKKEYASNNSFPLNESVYSVTNKVIDFAKINNVHLKSILIEKNPVYEFSFTQKPYHFFQALYSFCKKEKLSISLCDFEVLVFDKKHICKIIFERKNQIDNVHIYDTTVTEYFNKSFIDFNTKNGNSEQNKLATTQTSKNNSLQKIGFISTKDIKTVYYIEDSNGKITAIKETAN